ncbi:MAG: ATP-binding protein [Candidatus Falkowbacteria bacterium]
MTFYIIIHFLIAIFSALFGVLVFLRNTKSSVNRSFGLLTISIIIWSASYSIWLLSEDYESALFWARTLNLGGTLIPVLYFNWVINFLHLKRKIFLIFYFILTSIFVFFSFSEYYIYGVKQVLNFPYWPQANWMHALFLILGWVVIISHSFYLLINEYKKYTGDFREQIKYIIFASLIGFIGGSTNFLLMLGIDLIPPIGSGLVIIYPFIFAYAFAYHKLMNIKNLNNELKSTLNFNKVLKKEVKKATTKFRLANKELKKLDKAKSEFISIASHQLRTPLTVTKGYISMMIDGNFGKMSKKEIESLKKVYDSNEKLIKLSEELLHVANIESGRFKYNFKKIRIEKLVDNVKSKFLEETKKRKLKFKYIKPENKLPEVLADEEKIKDVIIDLFDNAVKYTKKGCITTEIKQRGEKIYFYVFDTGLGVNKEELTNLFKKFSRGKDSFLMHTEGIGLSLYTSKIIIKDHNGNIYCKSKGRDKGSMFCFSLPVSL